MAGLERHLKAAAIVTEAEPACQARADHAAAVASFSKAVLMSRMLMTPIKL
jgi:hypothetical protein